MIESCITRAAKYAWLSSMKDDEVWIALYTSAASLGPATTHYTTKGEASGLGYKAGGMRMTGQKCMAGRVAYMDWDHPVWPVATIAADGAMIYNKTKGGLAIAVLSFGATIRSTNGPFRVELPPAGTGSTAVVRIE